MERKNAEGRKMMASKEESLGLLSQERLNISLRRVSRVKRDRSSRLCDLS